MSRVAILGAGHISDYHIAGLRDAGADVVAVWSRTEARAREKARQHGIARHTADRAGLLASKEVDAVVIATPDFTHEALAVEAAAAGKAILLQKPMARTAAECRRILDAARRRGVLLCVSFLHRYFDEVRAARALLAEGALGRILHVRQRNATPGADWAAWFYQREQVGGGVVLQLGVHGIDLVRQLFGEITAVRATTARTRERRRLADGSVVVPDNEDLALATYGLAAGPIVTHEMSYSEVAGTDRFRLEIYGETGTAWLRTERGRLAVHPPRRGPERAAGLAWVERDGWAVAELPPANPGRRQHAAFLAMVRGEAPPDGSADDGLAGILVAEAIYRSAAADAWEPVGRP